jgi:hypothetical protein
MRQLICATLVLGSLVLAAPQANAAAQGRAAAQKISAVSAERYGAQASYRGPALEHGYSARALRIADCLATYPGYDPKSDRVTVRPGVTRRCAL